MIKPPEIPIPEPYPVEIEQLSEQLMDVSRQAVRNYLNEMKERLPVECETCVVENNNVSSAIQELASQEEDIDLVVLCAHGYTGQVPPGLMELSRAIIWNMAPNPSWSSRMCRVPRYSRPRRRLLPKNPGVVKHAG